MKKKSFSEIVPLWSKKLKKGFKKANEACVVDGQALNIHNYTQCIVGEAYRFTPSKNNMSGYSIYDDPDEEAFCPQCKIHANEFDKYIRDIAYDTDVAIKSMLREGFKEEKKNFVEHWNEKHLS